MIETIQDVKATDSQNAAPSQSGYIDASATGSLVNSVTVAGPTGSTDPNSANNTATSTLTLTTLDDLDISIANAASTPGSSDAYTITITNSGPSTISSLTLTDTLPSIFPNAVFTPSSGTYHSATGTWSGVSIASGQSITLTVAGTINPTASGSMLHPFSVAARSAVTDSNHANNSGSSTIHSTAVLTYSGVAMPGVAEASWVNQSTPWDSLLATSILDVNPVTAGTHSVTLHADDVLNMSGNTIGDLTSKDSAFTALNLSAADKILLIKGSSSNTVNLAEGNWTLHDTAGAGYSAFIHAGSAGGEAVVLANSDITNVVGQI